MNEGRVRTGERKRSVCDARCFDQLVIELFTLCGMYLCIPFFVLSFFPARATMYAGTENMQLKKE